MTSKTPAEPILASDIESALKRHVLDAWFPRCIDRMHGGFLCDFDQAWAPAGEHDKLIEFQARQTLLAAVAHSRYPDRPGLREAALHGFRCLQDTLWDPLDGGWFHRTDRAGSHLESGTKHTHGLAYGIAACAAVFTATGERRSLDLAREGFGWIEKYAHDDRHGGYIEFFARGGKPIVARGDHGWDQALDTIGTPLGCKDANVHTDLLQAFTYLHRAWPDPKVAERLEELSDIVINRLVAPNGAMHFMCSANWSPLPGLQRFGYAFQGAYRLLVASSVIGQRDRAMDAARRILAVAFDLAEDRERGGFYVAAPGTAALEVDGFDMVVRRKPWWVQMEALTALVVMLEADLDAEGYDKRLAALWRFVAGHVLDNHNGGTFTLALDDLSRSQRRGDMSAVPSAWVRKGSAWKDGSHEGNAMLRLAKYVADRGGSLP